MSVHSFSLMICSRSGDYILRVIVGKVVGNEIILFAVVYIVANLYVVDRTVESKG